MNSKLSLSDLVDRARTLPPAQQAEFLRSACSDNDELYSRAMMRLDLPADAWWNCDVGEDFEADVGAECGPGEPIGPYRIVRSLGQGGMGEVFLAERADKHFIQRVAIKIVKPGLVSQQVQTRLRLERQILATLDHPNIARLLDGGATRDGRPYIVMEYVEGLPIDEYCDTRRLSIEDRLRLFQTVCSAVHCAHQNLIVHRDLKPSNILVTAEGSPKLLDFGIAKLLDSRQVEQTLALTRADYRLMTPDHASPEQVQGLPVTTASDIYVLGVLLYELLTGRRPFEFRDKRLSEIERAICEDQPISPSAMLQSGAQGFSAPASPQFAGEHPVSLRKLARQLRGDLDNIVLMAMRKEPERRYPSVEQFSADIGRYLSGHPVMARKDTWSYRTAKFARRHVASVVLGSALVVLLIASAVISTLQANRIRHERDAVAVQRLRAEAVSEFLVDLFRVSDPIEGGGPDITARELLDRGAISLASGVSNDRVAQATLQETVGRVYLNLGLTQQAEPLLTQSLNTRAEALGESHPDYAASLAAVAELNRRKGEFDEAEKQIRQALLIDEAAGGLDTIAAAGRLQRLGNILFDRSELASAEMSLRRSLNLHQSLLEPGDPRVSLVMDDLANTMQMRGDLAGAEALYRRALQIDRSSLGEHHPQYAFHLENLARIIQTRGDLQAAEDLYMEAISVLRAALGESHPETVTAMRNIAALLLARRELDRAEHYYTQALDFDRRSHGSRHINIGHDLSGLAALAIARGEAAEAETYLRQALEIFSEKLPSNHILVATCQANLGRSLVDLGRWSEAHAVLVPAVDSVRRNFGEQGVYVAIARISLARSLAGLKRFDEAEGHFKESFPILSNAYGPASEVTQRARKWIEEFYERWGRPAAANEFFRIVTPGDREATANR